MDTPGNVLKVERQRQKKNLKDVAKKLKIKIEFLHAIEDENYSVLPAEVYTKAYLRTYADLLGLEPDYVLNLYNSQMEEGDIKERGSSTGEGEGTAPLKNSFLRALTGKPILIAALLVFIVLAAVMFKLSDEQKPIKTIVPIAEKPVVEKPVIEKPVIEKPVIEKPVVEKPVVEKPVVEKPVVEKPVVEKPVVEKPVIEEPVIEEPVVEKPVVEKPVIEEPVVEEPVVEEPVVEKPVVEKPIVEKPVVEEPVIEEPVVEELEVVEENKPEELSLIIHANELTWVSVSIDNGKPREWVMRAGDSTGLTARKMFAVKIGNAGGTSLVFNGQDVGTLGPPGKVVDIVLPRKNNFNEQGHR
jgi:cytoskeletal protein RodZ